MAIEKELFHQQIKCYFGEIAPAKGIIEKIENDYIPLQYQHQGVLYLVSNFKMNILVCLTLSKVFTIPKNASYKALLENFDL